MKHVSLVVAFCAISAASAAIPAASAAPLSIVKTPNARHLTVMRLSPRLIRMMAAKRTGVRFSSASSSSSAASTTSSSASRSSNAAYDPLPDSVPVSSILLLNQTSPIIAGARFFSNLEPVQMQSFLITLSSAASDVDSLKIYAGDGRLLGVASAYGFDGTAFRLPLKTGAFDLGRREDRTIYMRAVLKAHDGGGVGGQQVQVATVEADGFGSWSNNQYTSTSADTFTPSQTARGTITAINAAGSTQEVLVSGVNQTLGAFRFSQQTNDGQAKVSVQSIRFQIEGSNSNITVSNVSLHADDDATVLPCTVSTAQIACSGFTTTFGAIGSGKIFRVYGDVAVGGSVQDPLFRLTINNPGTPGSSGDVTWTDGTNTFDWLPLSHPIARGTLYR